jgi:hypothetical protein
MNRSFRRVVTGHNAQGKSVFIIDDVARHVFSRGPGSAIVTEMWETTATPASNRGSADAIARKMRLPPPKQGSVFRIIEYPPDKERVAALNRERASGGDGGSGHDAAFDRNNPRHPASTRPVRSTTPSCLRAKSTH